MSVQNAPPETALEPCNGPRLIQAFLAFLAFHLLVWTILPSLFYPNLRLDQIESLVYGREWQIGYDKLPPLPWWLVELTWQLFGSEIALYAASQLAVVLAFACVWLLARR